MTVFDTEVNRLRDIALKEYSTAIQNRNGSDARYWGGYLDALDNLRFNINASLGEVLTKPAVTPKPKELTEKTYFTVHPIWDHVSKEEFDFFIENYPRKLERHCSGMSSPNYISYNDFELADRYPSSVVASYLDWSACPTSPYYKSPSDRVYNIMKNINEVYATRKRRECDD